MAKHYATRDCTCTAQMWAGQKRPKVCEHGNRFQTEAELKPPERAPLRSVSLEAARRLLVRIDHSFSREGRSWSPPSLLKDRKGRWQPRTWQDMPERLIAAARRLQNVCLERTDAVDLIPRWDLPETVIYIDPPYIGPDRKHPRHGYKHDAVAELWPRLIDALLEIENAAVILSGYPNDEADRLGWRTVDLHALRNVAARDGSTLPKVPETLWLSPAVPEPWPDLLTAHPDPLPEGSVAP